MPKKRCSKCKKGKPLDAFHRNRRIEDGRARECRDCANARTVAWRKQNPDYKKHWQRGNREKEREYRKRWGEENRERELQLNRESRTRNPGTLRARAKRYRERHPEKARAHNLVGLAVFHGKLQKPSHCEGCGQPFEKAKLQGHHEDYERPLEVEWLCLSCHRKRHEAT